MSIRILCCLGLKLKAVKIQRIGKLMKEKEIKVQRSIKNCFGKPESNIPSNSESNEIEKVFHQGNIWSDKERETFDKG